MRDSQSVRVAHTMSRCLAHFFEDTLPSEQAIRIHMVLRDEKVYEANALAICYLEFGFPSSDHLIHGRLTVEHSGGNIYDVRVQLAGGKEQPFTLCVPDPEWPAEALRPSMRKICNFLLVELERLAGEIWLRQATRAARRRAPSQPSEPLHVA